MDRLNDSDLGMLRSAYSVMQEAQAVLAFAQQQIAQRYGVHPGDAVDIHSGQITRQAIGPAAGTPIADGAGRADMAD